MYCLNCQKYTSNPKFCSRSCAASLNNKGRTRNLPKARQCKKCGKDYFKSRSIFCASCRDQRSTSLYQSKTLAEYQSMLSVKGKHPSWINAHVRNFNRSWNKELTKLPCQSCGYSRHVELCHKVAVSSFPLSTTLGKVNDPRNILVLCRNCHWEYDNGLLVLRNPMPIH